MKNIIYYMMRSLNVIRTEGFRTFLFAALGRILGKDAVFFEFIFRKGRYLFRGSDIGFSMIKDSYEYIHRPGFSERLNTLENGLGSESRRAIQKFMQRIELFRDNNVVHESEVFDEDDYLAQSRAIAFMAEKGILHPTGYYVFDKPELLLRLDGGIVIDCGACDGTESIMFAKLSPDSSRVYSFEPNESNFSKLLRNIASSGFTSKITPFKLGLSDKEDKLRFYGIDGGEITSSPAVSKDNMSFEEVHVVSLDGFVSSNAPNERVALIKWDIEGGEHKSILGAKNVICRDKPILAVSIYHNGEQFFETKSLLESWGLGYSFEIIQSEPENTWAGYVLLAY